MEYYYTTNFGNGKIYLAEKESDLCYDDAAEQVARALWGKLGQKKLRKVFPLDFTIANNRGKKLFSGTVEYLCMIPLFRLKSYSDKEGSWSREDG